MAATRLVALHHVKTKTVAECLKRSIDYVRDSRKTVRNISIVESKAGNLFMSMPSYKTKTVDENGKAQFKDIAYPVTKDFREKLQEKILQSYESGEDIIFEV